MIFRTALKSNHSSLITDSVFFHSPVAKIYLKSSKQSSQLTVALGGQGRVVENLRCSVNAQPLRSQVVTLVTLSSSCFYHQKCRFRGYVHFAQYEVKRTGVGCWLNRSVLITWTELCVFHFYQSVKTLGLESQRNLLLLFPLEEQIIIRSYLL